MKKVIKFIMFTFKYILDYRQRSKVFYKNFDKYGIGYMPKSKIDYRDYLK